MHTTSLLFPSIYMHGYNSVCLSVYLSVCLSVCLRAIGSGTMPYIIIHVQMLTMLATTTSMYMHM